MFFVIGHFIYRDILCVYFAYKKVRVDGDLSYRERNSNSFQLDSKFNSSLINFSM